MNDVQRVKVTVEVELPGGMEESPASVVTGIALGVAQPDG